MKHASSFILATLLPGTSLAAVYSAGHADVFAIGYEGGELEPHFHAESAVIDGIPGSGGEFEPDEIVTLVPQSTFHFVSTNGGRPAAAGWDAIGVAAGQSYWFLPQSNSGPGGAATLGAPFAGVGAEELVPAEWSTPITIRLDSVTGPGQFSMWLDGFSPNFVIATADGIDASDFFTIAAGSHEHYNLGFTAAGDYQVNVTMSGTHAVDGFKTASATYNFGVVPEPSAALLASLGLLAAVRRRR